MTDRITNERLREIAGNDDAPLLSYSEVRDIAAELLAARAEIERLKSRVGWLDHLDTEEGRKLHANEALLVEVERLKAELAKAKEAT